MSKSTNLTALNRAGANSLEKARADRDRLVAHHLEELGKQLRMKQEAFDVCLKAELGRGGVPGTAEERQALLERCEAMAELAGRRRARELHEEVGALAKHLNVHTFPDAVVWAAKRVGVQLEEPQLVDPAEH